LAGMRAAGAIVCLMLSAMKSTVRPGITTAELDEVGAGVMRQHGARSAPALVYKFPGVNCISVNEEAVHGIPGRARGPAQRILCDSRSGRPRHRTHHP
jgi:methionyl aminopeptidase